MSDDQRTTDGGGRVQFWAVVLVTLLVMVLGVLVVAYPERMGVPRPAPVPSGTPIVTVAP